MSQSSTEHRSRSAQLASVVRTIAWSEFKLRYAGSALGYFWSVAKPLMLFSVLYLVFHRLLRLGQGVDRFPEMLLLGIVLWSFFAETTTGCVTVLVQRADLLRKVSFPAIALPLAVAATASIAFAFNLATVMVLLFVSGITPTWHWLWFPLLLAELLVTTVGVSFVLSSLFVTLRDIGQLWEVVAQLLFYATPIIYPISLLPTVHVLGHSVDLQPWAMINPIGQVIEQGRRILVLGSDGTIGDVLPGLMYLVPLAVSVSVFAVGFLLFQRASVRMVEQL